jgi:hypothetical protein
LIRDEFHVALRNDLPEVDVLLSRSFSGLLAAAAGWLAVY